MLYGINEKGSILFHHYTIHFEERIIRVHCDRDEQRLLELQN